MELERLKAVAEATRSPPGGDQPVTLLQELVATIAASKAQLEDLLREDTTEDQEHVGVEQFRAESLILAARALRNACAGGATNCRVLAQTDVLETGFAALSMFAHVSSVVEEGSRTEYNQYRAAFAQLLANFAASGGAEHVWQFLFPTKMMDLTALCVQDRKCLGYAVACIYNCVRDKVSTRLVELAQSRQALCQLLLWAASTTSSTQQTEEEAKVAAIAERDPAESWMHLLCRLFFQHNLAGTVYTTIASRWRKAELAVRNEPANGAENAEEPEALEPIIVNPEQLLLLQLCSDDGVIAAEDTLLWERLGEDLRMLLGDSQQPRTEDQFLQSMHAQAIDVILGFTSNAIVKMHDTHPDASPIFKDRVLAAGFLEACVHLLQSLQASTREKQAMPDHQVEHIRSSLGFIATLVYRHQPAQDRLRECGGLATILSYCGTLFNVPLAREWALFAVRNACEGNFDNQAFIEALKPQQVLQDESLAAAGVSVELDPAKGIRFSHNKQQPPR